MSTTEVRENEAMARGNIVASPTSFAQSELGPLPEDWTVEPCADLCVKIQDGTHFSPRVTGGDYLYVTSRNVGFGTLDVSNAGTINETEHRKIFGRCDTRKGDLLLTKDGANTGNAAINNLEDEISLLSSVAFLRFKPENDARFFLQYILSHPGQERIKQLMSGNAITRLTLSKIRPFLMPRPPSSEQRTIAVALSEVDALIGALDKLIAKKRGMKLGAMQQLLTGRTRLPGFRAAWERTSLKNIAPLQRGFDLPTYRLAPGRFPVAYSNGVLNHHSTWMVKGPGVVTGRSGTIGRVFFIDDDFWPHNTALWVTSFHNNDPRFVFYLYSFIGFDRFGTGSGVPTLNRNDVHAHEITYPSDPEEQAAIAANLSDMDAEIAALERRRDKTKKRN